MVALGNEVFFWNYLKEEQKYYIAQIQQAKTHNRRIEKAITDLISEVV